MPSFFQVSQSEWRFFLRGRRWLLGGTTSERLGFSTCPTQSRWTNGSSLWSVLMCREGVNDVFECWERWRARGVGMPVDGLIIIAWVNVKCHWTRTWHENWAKVDWEVERTNWETLKSSSISQTYSFRVLFIELGLTIEKKGSDPNAADFAGIISLRAPGNWFEQARCPSNLSRQTMPVRRRPRNRSNAPTDRELGTY